jgi:phosphohistidine phosphatase
MQRMAHTLRHRLGHPVETTLELLGGKWKFDILAILKERLLYDAPQTPQESAEPRGSELHIPKNGLGQAERLSPEAGNVMQLYVVRHGIAVEGGEGIPDEWRPLTDKGRRRFQKMARAFAKLGRRLDLILTSPLVRAVQTAEILAGAADHGEVAVLAELDPKFDVEAVRKAISTRAEKAEAVAIVGHEPQLSSLLATLSKVSPADLDLEKGAIVRVDVSTLIDGASADPRWWLKPKGTRKKGLPLRKQPGETLTEAGSTQTKRVSKKSRRGIQAVSESDSAPESPVVDEEASETSPSPRS